jgi:hypothetical protein
MMPLSFVDRYLHFEATCRLYKIHFFYNEDGGGKFIRNVGAHLSKLDGVTSQKTVILRQNHENF